MSSLISGLSASPAGGDVRHQHAAPEESRPGVIIIGYLEETEVLLLPNVGFPEVARGDVLKFSATDIGR